jgi:WD40 repeat protein
LKIVTLSQDGSLIIWLIENGQKLKTFTDLHAGAELTAFEFDEMGTRFYTGASDGLVKVWDFNGHCYHTLEANEGANCEIAQILAIKRRILAMGWKKSLTVFRDTTMKEERVKAGEWKCVRDEHQEDILCATIMLTQPMFLITGGFDGDIVVWNSVTEQPYKHLSARKRPLLVKKEVLHFTEYKLWRLIKSKVKWAFKG